MPEIWTIHPNYEALRGGSLGDVLIGGGRYHEVGILLAKLAERLRRRSPALAQSNRGTITWCPTRHTALVR